MHRLQQGDQASAQGGQAVFDVWWYGLEVLPGDKTGLLKLA